MMTPGPPMNTHGARQHTTRPQPHEQLLMGWIVGGIGPTRVRGEDEGAIWQQGGKAATGRRDGGVAMCGGRHHGRTPAPRSTPNPCHEPLLVGWEGVLHA